MKKNEVSNGLKTALVLFVLAFVVSSCGNTNNKDSRNTKDDKQPNISIEYHTPESLKKYNEDVAAYHAAQQKIQADTIKSAQKIER